VHRPASIPVILISPSLSLCILPAACLLEGAGGRGRREENCCLLEAAGLPRRAEPSLWLEKELCSVTEEGRKEGGRRRPGERHCSCGICHDISFCWRRGIAAWRAVRQHIPAARRQSYTTIEIALLPGTSLEERSWRSRRMPLGAEEGRKPLKKKEEPQLRLPVQHLRALWDWKAGMPGRANAAAAGGLRAAAAARTCCMKRRGASFITGSSAQRGNYGEGGGNGVEGEKTAVCLAILCDC